MPTPPHLTPPRSLVRAATTCTAPVDVPTRGKMLHLHRVLMATLSLDEKHAAALCAFEKAEHARFLGDGNIHRGLHVARLIVTERRVEAKVQQRKASADASEEPGQPDSTINEGRRRRRRSKRQTKTADPAVETGTPAAHTAETPSQELANLAERAQLGDSGSSAGETPASLTMTHVPAPASQPGTEQPQRLPLCFPHPLPSPPSSHP